MAEEKDSKGSFWTTLPGILTGAAALVTALAGLWAGLHHSSSNEAPADGHAAIVEGPAVAGSRASSAVGEPVSTAVPTTVPSTQGDVTVTARSGNVTRLTLKSFHHNMTEDSVSLASGQSIPMEKLRRIDFGTVDADARRVAVTLTLADGRTVSDDLATNYSFQGSNDLGPFSIFVQDVRQIAFPR